MIQALIWWYIFMIFTTAVAFFIDKRLAQNGARRIPEKWLHSLEIMGGWPGALVASELFRHKRQKTSYMYPLYAISALHILLWGLYFTKVF